MCKNALPATSRKGVLTCGSGFEHTGVGETLLGGRPAVVRELLVQRLDLRTDLGAVAGRGDDTDLLDEGVRVGPVVRGLAVGQVAHVRELAVRERGEVLELTEHA